MVFVVHSMGGLVFKKVSHRNSLQLILMTPSSLHAPIAHISLTYSKSGADDLSV